jgi:hypothetical protein
MDKNCARVILILLSVAMPAIPAGGDMFVKITGANNAPLCEIRCKGRNARIPEGALDIFRGRGTIDPRNIITYYCYQLARSCRLTLTVQKEDTDIVFFVKPRR